MGFVNYVHSELRERAATYDRRSATDAASAARILRQVVGDSPKEHFVALYLDVRHRPVGVEVVSVGTLTSAIVHPREVFGPALRLGTAAAVIIGHNHPSSGDASEEDWAVTKRLREAGTLLGVPVLDHLLLKSNGENVSLRTFGRWS